MASGRRGFMLGSLGAALLGPFASCVSAAPPDPSTRALGRAKRLVVVFFSGGFVPGDNVTADPKGDETRFTLGPVLAPLERHRRDLLVIGGLGQRIGWDGGGHNRIATLLTSVPATGVFRPADQPDDVVDSAGGISVDQFIGQKISAGLAFRSVNLGVQFATDMPGWRHVSYLGPRAPVPADDSPYQAFRRVFGGLAGQTDATRFEHARLTRRSVLDFVKGDVQALHRALGAEDRVRLDQHLESIRVVETALESTWDPAKAPLAPTPVLDIHAGENYPALLRMQTDLLVAALAAGRTNVGVLQGSSARNDALVASWLGVSDQHHTLQHDYVKTAASRASLVKVNAWFHEQVAYLLDRLAETREADGTRMLDNTIVVRVDNLGEPAAHGPQDIPIVVAGGGGAFRTGRHVDFSAACDTTSELTHARFLVSLCRAFGIDTESFGDPAYCTGGALPGLT